MKTRRSQITWSSATTSSTGRMLGSTMWRSRCQAAGAVDLGGLHHLLGDLGQRGVHREGHERHAHPDDDDGRDEEEGQRLEQPRVALVVATELGEHVVDRRRTACRRATPTRSARRRPASPRRAAGRSAAGSGSRFDMCRISSARPTPMAIVAAALTRQKTSDRSVTRPQVRVGDQLAVVLEADPLRRLAELLGQAEVLEGQHAPGAPAGSRGRRRARRTAGSSSTYGSGVRRGARWRGRSRRSASVIGPPSGRSSGRAV